MVNLIQDERFMLFFHVLGVGRIIVCRGIYPRRKYGTLCGELSHSRAVLLLGHGSEHKIPAVPAHCSASNVVQMSWYFYPVGWSGFMVDLQALLR
jgi:hypothetical protein